MRVLGFPGLAGPGRGPAAEAPEWTAPHVPHAPCRPDMPDSMAAVSPEGVE